jgi:hypothetical protein
MNEDIELQSVAKAEPVSLVANKPISDDMRSTGRIWKLIVSFVDWIWKVK